MPLLLVALPLVASSFLFRVEMPGAISSFLLPVASCYQWLLVTSSFLFLVEMPGAISSFLILVVSCF